MSKVLFITGASSGIGRATAKKAVAADWKVGLMARRESALVELRDELGNDNVAVYAGDATKLEAQVKAVDQLVERFGQLDAAFANAGVGIDKPGTENGDPEEWRKMIDINILGVLWTAQGDASPPPQDEGPLPRDGLGGGALASQGVDLQLLEVVCAWICTEPRLGDGRVERALHGDHAGNGQHRLLRQPEAGQTHA